MKIVDEFVHRSAERIVATNVLRRQAAHILHGPLITEVGIHRSAVHLHFQSHNTVKFDVGCY
jgi:hypothetical protein